MARKLPIVIEAIFLALQKPVYNGKKFARAKALMRPSCVRVHKWTRCMTYVRMCILNNKKKKERKEEENKKEKKRKKKETCICVNNRTTPTRKEEPASYTRN